MKKAIFILFLFLFCGKAYLQEQDTTSRIQEIKYDNRSNLSPVEFEKDKIERYKADEEFDYINATEKDNWWTRFKKWVSARYNDFINWLFGDYEANSILSFFISILPFLLLLTLLGLIAWLFSRLNPGGKILETPKSSEVYISEEEELVKNEDLSKLMKEAVQNGEFRLAVRYYYLNELRKLDELHLIEYAFQKTNKDYQDEIKDEKIRKHFTEISKVYEFIWYGSFQVSETDFLLAEKGFSRMDDLLKTSHHE